MNNNNNNNNNMKYTKKIKRGIKNKTRFLKRKSKHGNKIGGATSETCCDKKLNSENEKIMDEVKDKRKVDLGAISEIYNVANAIAQEKALNAVNTVGTLAGVDFSADSVNGTRDKLERMNQNLRSPETLKQIRQSTTNIARTGADIVDASEPFVDPLIDKVINKGTEVAKKVVDSGMEITMNGLKAIPFVGTAIAGVDAIDKTLSTGFAVYNFGADTITDTIDAIQAARMKYNQIQKDGSNTQGRIDKSVDNFEKPTAKEEVKKDEAEVKKDEAEVKKDEAEVKKDEEKKDEAEVKKDEAEVKKDEAEVKKDETKEEKKEDEAEEKKEDEAEEKKEEKEVKEEAKEVKEEAEAVKEEAEAVKEEAKKTPINNINNINNAANSSSANNVVNNNYVGSIGSIADRIAQNVNKKMNASKGGGETKKNNKSIKTKTKRVRFAL